MKKLLFAFIAITALSCEKKDEIKDTALPLVIEVSQLSPKTSISIIATDQNQKEILNVSNKFGNANYETLPVNDGDVITVKVKSNVPYIYSSGEKNGWAGIVYYYNGKDLAGSFGGLSYPDWRVRTVTIEKR